MPPTRGPWRSPCIGRVRPEVVLPSHACLTPIRPPAHPLGDVWHCEVKGLKSSGVLYGLRATGAGGWEAGGRWDPSVVLLDPYAPLVSGRRRFGTRDEVERFKPKVGSTFRGSFDFESAPFDWGEGYQRPGHQLKVRGPAPPLPALLLPPMLWPAGSCGSLMHPLCCRLRPLLSEEEVPHS